MAITIDELKRNVFPGESGGDYNALFGYANRPGGQFAGTNLTDMTVDQALQFASPSGPYGQSVKGQIGRVATPMGAWQVVGTTLKAAKQGLGLTGSEKMTPELQDAIGMWIYQAQGPGAWEGWGKKGAGGGGSASAAAASAPNTGTMPMGLLDMQDEPQTFAERLKSQWQSGELGDRIALAANTLRLNPDQNLAAALQDRQQAREQKSTMNRTAQWLISQGRGDLAQAMLTGAVDPKSAVAVAMQPADPLAAIQLEKAQIELEQLRNPQPDASNVVVVDGKLVDKMTGQIVYAGTPETPDPQSAIAKLEADLRAGLISQEQYQAALAAMAPQGMSIETGPDGQLRIVQGAGAGMGKPFTEAQSKDVVYSTRAQGALEVLEPVSGSLTSLQSRAAEFDPTGYVRGAVQSPEYQVAKNAGDEFLQAILRKDTGAGITAQEQELYGKTYLPQPGDGPQVLEAKKAARQRAVAAINAGMSPQQMVAAERANGATTGAPAAGGPSDDDLLRMYGVGQ